MKKPARLLLFCWIGYWLSPQLLHAQSSRLWQPTSGVSLRSDQHRIIVPEKESIFHVDEPALAAILATAPEEFSAAASQQQHQLSLPMPDGQTQQFSIVHSPIAEQALLDKYPDIRTYYGRGIDDPTATVRLDLTPAGFHAMMLSASGAIFIDPYARGMTDTYSSYYKQDFSAQNEDWVCEFKESNKDLKHKHQAASGRSFGDCQFRSYRFAVAATGEYTAYHGGKAGAIAAQITTMNRVNGVLERDAAIRLIIIGNNDTLVYTNASTDPYTNGNPGSMIGQNQSNINSVIGAANYDLGHVFGTNSGGLAGLGVLCANNSKALGVTGNSNPIGDPFDIDYVAHEIGHQLGARHTFNGTAGACGGNGSSIAAFEPGSGSTIMAYAGICGSQNVQSNSDAYYHAYSLEEMAAVITGTTCGTIISMSNTEPVISHPALSYVIPANTPFFLESAATDADGDSLTYCWEQFDNQSSTQPPVSSSTDGPNFRSLDPTPEPRRYFPKLSDIVNGTSTTWEVLPSVSRTMNFKVTVRDNALGGCTDAEDATIQVDGNAGPFLVTNPNTSGISWSALSSRTIAWNVAGTDQAPVSCDLVDILLSVDGGQSFPITLASNIPNTGSHVIGIPDTASTAARIMIVCSNGIFYDVSDEDFTITAVSGPDYYLNSSLFDPVFCPPDSAVIPLTVGSILGYQDTVMLTANISPASSMNALIDIPNIIAGNTATLTIQNIGLASPGTYTLSIDGNSNAGMEQFSLTFEVGPGMLSTTVLTSPADGAIGTSQMPQFDWQATVGADSYILEVASDSMFTIIVATEDGLTSPTATMTAGLDPLTFYYWRALSVNACDTSFSDPFLFFTGELACDPFASTDVPVSIATVPTTVFSTLPISLNAVISDITVTNLNGTHSWINDLRISLTSPAGTTVILMDQVCGNENNFDLEFSDMGAAYSSIPCPPVGGATYQPSESLSGFVGENAQGTWTLTIEDFANQDGGSLDGWGLEICYNDPNTCTLNSTVMVMDESCNGNCDGMASVPNPGGTAPYSYQWSNSSTDSTAMGLCAGGYTVVISDANGCLGAGMFHIQSAPPAFSASLATTDVSCFGESDGSVSFSINGGTAPYTIDLGGADSAALSAGSYTAYISDMGGCVDSFTFVIDEPSSLAFDFGPDTEICDGETVNLDASGFGQNLSYLWSTGDTTPVISISTTGDYWLQITDAGNCTASDTLGVDVLPVPTAAFTSTINVGEVSLQNASSMGTYLWLFGDGDSSMDANPVHTYSENGTYTITLIVDLGNGCPPDTTSQEVMIDGIVGLDVLRSGTVSVFPNPVSDQFVIELVDVSFKEAKLTLVNHLGQEVLKQSFVISSDRHQEQLPVGNLAEGIYHLSIEREGSFVFSEKIVIQR